MLLMVYKELIYCLGQRNHSTIIRLCDIIRSIYIDFIKYVLSDERFILVVVVWMRITSLHHIAAHIHGLASVDLMYCLWDVDWSYGV